MHSGDGVGAEGGSNADARISGVVQSMLSIQRTLLDEESSSGGKQDATVSLTNLTVDQARAKIHSQAKSISSKHTCSLRPRE